MLILQISVRNIVWLVLWLSMTIQRLRGSIKTSKVVVSSEDVIHFSNQSVFPEHNDLNVATKLFYFIFRCFVLLSLESGIRAH